MLGLNRCSVIHLICLVCNMPYAPHASLFWLLSMHVLDSFWHVLGLFWVAFVIYFMLCIAVVQLALLALCFDDSCMLSLSYLDDLASFNMTFQSI